MGLEVSWVRERGAGMGDSMGGPKVSGCVNPFIPHLLRTCHVTDAMLGPGDIVVNK